MCRNNISCFLTSGVFLFVVLCSLLLGNSSRVKDKSIVPFKILKYRKLPVREELFGHAAG